MLSLVLGVQMYCPRISNHAKRCTGIVRMNYRIALTDLRAGTVSE